MTDHSLPIPSLDARTEPGTVRGYAAKVLTVCFLGTHAPLVALAVYALGMLDGGLAAQRDLLLVALGATLVGTALTLWTVHALLQPLLRRAAG